MSYPHAPALSVLARTGLIAVVIAGLSTTSACKGPESRGRALKLSINSQSLAAGWRDGGARREATKQQMEKSARDFVDQLFPTGPMPSGAPPILAIHSAAHQGVAGAASPGDDRPSWVDGVRRPASALEHDLPRAYPVQVRRGETPALLSKWAGTDSRTLLSDNSETLGKRRWFRTGDRLVATMSANQKVAFDKARDDFQQQRLDAYFAKRYFAKVVVYRVKRGEYISTAAKRYGDVPTWLLEEFNQIDFRSMRAGAEVLIPVVATYESGQRVPPLQVVDEAGRPLSVEKADRVNARLKPELIGRARMALDDSNVFEREDAGVVRSRVNQQLLPDYDRVGHVGAELGAGPAARPHIVRQIVAKKGESLVHLIQWSGVSLREIQQANPHIDPDRTLEGSRIAIPMSDDQYVHFISSRAKWSRARTAKASAPVPDKAVAAASRKTYTIQSGDTGLAIVKRHETTLGRLKKANPGVDLDRLRIGQKLFLP